MTCCWWSDWFDPPKNKAVFLPSLVVSHWWAGYQSPGSDRVLMRRFSVSFMAVNTTNDHEIRAERETVVKHVATKDHPGPVSPEATANHCVSGWHLTQHVWAANKTTTDHSGQSPELQPRLLSLFFKIISSRIKNLNLCCQRFRKYKLLMYIFLNDHFLLVSQCSCKNNWRRRFHSSLTWSSQNQNHSLRTTESEPQQSGTLLLQLQVLTDKNT